MAETVECRFCGVENESTVERCACGHTDWKVYPSGLFGESANPHPKADADFLRSIDRSLITIKRIAIYFLVLSIFAAVVEFLEWVSH